ncbi:MAG: TlpA disulfide reductase family protein [Prolixibacteraceae bacterium]|jgi:peroxiredoxin|nr:TlpA disulfide reductase family protein [Prolixibacteraceae bacterium]
MKQIILIAFVLGLFFACNQAPTYTINGNVADTTETVIFLQQRVGGDFVDIDSSVVENGTFQFEGKVEFPEEYYLSKGDRDKLLFFLENEDIEIKADSTLIKEAKVDGGAVQNLFNEYTEKYDRLYDYMLSIYYKAREEQDKDLSAKMEAQVDSLYENVQLFQETFMLENPTSPVAPYILTRIQYGKTAVELDSLLQQLDISLANMESYQFIANRITALKKVAIGATAPDFTQNDKDGNPITFSEVYGANKLTLLDFWASWCGPCRAENPNVVAAFEKYNTKGFTVFGVSLDNNKERWLKAIEDDGLTWQQVSDLKGWGNEFSKEYAVNSIPASFLVDQNGIIVASNARGEELHQKIEDLLY